MAALGDSFGKALQLFLQFFLAHCFSFSILTRAGSRRFQVPFKLLQGEANCFGLEERLLQIVQKLFLQQVLTNLEVVRARAPVEMLRATIHGVPPLPTSHDHQIAPAQAAFEEAGEQITAGSRAVQ